MNKTLSRLLHDRTGNFGIIMAIIAVPLIAATGIALDYSTALTKKKEIQKAADAAVLFAASSRETNKSKLKAIVEKAFAANITQQFGAAATITAIDVSDDHYITMKATATVPLTIAKIIQPEGIDVAVVAQALAGSADKIEVSLVLDNTYSMVGQDLANLKAASNSLLDVFENTDKGNTLARFAIVPFSRYVNVGIGNRNQSWLTVPADYSTTKNICTTIKPVLSQSGCTTQTKTGYNDGVAYTYTQKTCAATVYGAPVTTCSDKTSNFKWSGCVGSRKSPYDAQDIDPSKKYTGLLNTTCGSAITPLTDDYKVLRKAITAMVANNETYIAPGIIWGWNTLSDLMPFQEALDYDADVKKFMIVMTDGENTLSAKNYPLHDGTDKKKANATMLLTCTNAKAKGIVIYTVGVGISDTTTATELGKCATDSSKAITVDDSDKLLKVFENIATQILAPRLTM